MWLPFFAKVSTVTHRHRSHPACPTFWWMTSWGLPSKLGATSPPWISVTWRQTAEGRRLEGTSGCLLTACSMMTGTLLTDWAAPWPTPSSPAVRRWLETHTLMIKRSGAMEVCTNGEGLSSSVFCFYTSSLVCSVLLSGVHRWQQQHRPVHSSRARVWPRIRTVPFLLWSIHHEAVLPGWCGGHCQLPARGGRQTGHPAALWWVCAGLSLRLTLFFLFVVVYYGVILSILKMQCSNVATVQTKL